MDAFFTFFDQTQGYSSYRPSFSNARRWPKCNCNREALLSFCYNNQLTPPTEALVWLSKGKHRFHDQNLWQAIWHKISQSLMQNKFKLSGVHFWQSDLIALLVNQIVINCNTKYSSLEILFWQRTKKLFPKHKILRHFNIPQTKMHLDIFIPRKRIAIEVQGALHWRAINYFGGGKLLARVQQNDALKRTFCQQLGLYLIEVTAHTTEEQFYKKVLAHT